MTDDVNRLTRRKVLGSLGVMGGAAAMGGAGTRAFFSDQEEFEGNKLVAGELDLKVDWQEHYADWSGDENDDTDPKYEADKYGMEDDETYVDQFDDDDPMDFVVRMDEPSDPSKWTGFPTQAEEFLLWVPNGYVDDFMRNTAIEAYPDKDNDGIQDSFPSGDICKEAADTPDALSSDLRTNATIGGPPNPQTTEPGDPLVHIEDVKPGDFGELTLSFHLCDNPGFVWLTGELVGAWENGKSEPEREDPDEGPGVELLDAIQTNFWIDDGDNVFEDDEQLIFPQSLSLREALVLLEESDDGLGIPLSPPLMNGTEDPTDGDGVLTPGVCAETAVDSVDLSTDVFEEGTREAINPRCADFGLVEAIRIEEGDLPDPGDSQVYETAYGDLEVTRESDSALSAWVTDATAGNGTIEDEDGFCVSKVIVKGGPHANIYNYDDDELSSGDTGTFETPEGEGISHVDFCVDLRFVPDGDDDGDRQEECFENSTTHFVGFSWWLPVDHANEIQTDAVKFDLGFYTEQCRHNDGSGMPPENA